MNGSAAIADSLLQLPCMPFLRMQGAGSSFSRSTYCKEYASLPRDSARPFRNATARFRHELPWILRVPESGENGEPKLVYLVYLVYVVCLVG